MSFNPTAAYVSVVDHTGEIFMKQSNVWYDIHGNSYSSIPLSKYGYAAPTDPSSLSGGSSVPYDTVTISATTAGIRTAPAKVAGFIVTASSSGYWRLFASDLNSGTVIWEGLTTIGQIVTFPEPYSSFLGLSALLVSGTGTIAIMVL